MSIIKFDTLAASRQLQGLGFEPRQADGVVELFNKAVETNNEDLATKGDLALVKNELNAKIDRVEAALSAKIDKVESSLSAKIDMGDAVLNGKSDTIKAELTSLKWILGVLTAAVFSLVAKAFLFN
ncbi:hypothetical protein FACS1894103_3630 [Campylobacterota bacterium]|nr:hypothetical protein FACS1894103_3630 [Campylobacterota bacterium]